MRYPSRFSILIFLSLISILACRLPRLSDPEIRQQIIRVLDETSDEELVRDYIIVTPPAWPTPTFTPTLTPTLSSGAGELASGADTPQPAPAGSGGEPGAEGEAPGVEATSIPPIIAGVTPTPLPSIVPILPTASVLPSATALPPAAPAPTSTPVPPTSPPPHAPPPDDDDDDQPPPPLVEVGFSQANFGVDEDINTITIDVVLAAPSTQPVTVNYASSNGSATAGSDYGATSGSLTFAPFQTSQSFGLPIINDNVADEFNETINLSLSNPVNATLGLAAAVVTLRDDDPVLQFDQAAYGVGEGEGTAGVTVVLNAISSLPVSVDYTTVPGSATAGSDYEAVSGRLTVPPGLASNSFTVPITEDSIVEADETLHLTLSNPANGTLGLAAATLTLQDNDLSVQFSSATYNVLENSGAAVITVTLNNPSPRVVTVLYSTGDGTATASDYFASAGILTIPAGATGGNFTVPIIDDVLVEAPETVILSLSAPVNASLGATQVATLSLISDDNNPIVNTSGDSDDGECDLSHCTLREALQATNGSPGPDVISFNIPGGGPHTISPGSPLPAITGPVSLDGLTQPGAGCHQPLIKLDGSSAGANVDGLWLSAGSSAIQGLVINRFGGNGLRIDSDDNRIQCNYIGTDPALSSAGNGAHGIYLNQRASANIIGETLTNVVAYNGRAGVFVTAAGNRNLIRGNDIFDNAGLEIDLEPEGITPNDLDDLDTGANQLQNAPVITTAIQTGINTRVSGILNSRPAGNYILEFFTHRNCDPSSASEGGIMIGMEIGQSNNDGNLYFSFLLHHTDDLSGQSLTATATDAEGNTSEFSACLPVN